MTRTTRIGSQVLLVALTAAGCKKEAMTAKAVDADVAVAVSLVAAHEVKTPRVVTLSGTLTGSEEAQVAAGAAGKVLATYVERGSGVKEGAGRVRPESRAATAPAAAAGAQAEGA